MLVSVCVMITPTRYTFYTCTRITNDFRARLQSVIRDGRCFDSTSFVRWPQCIIGMQTLRCLYSTSQTTVALRTLKAGCRSSTSKLNFRLRRLQTLQDSSTMICLLFRNKYRFFTLLPRHVVEPMTLTLVGNKIDLEKTRAVSREEAFVYATSINGGYFETSAISDIHGIEMVFISTARSLLHLAQTTDCSSIKRYDSTESIISCNELTGENFLEFFGFFPKSSSNLTLTRDDLLCFGSRTRFNGERNNGRLIRWGQWCRALRNGSVEHSAHCTRRSATKRLVLLLNCHIAIPMLIHIKIYMKTAEPHSSFFVQLRSIVFVSALPRSCFVLINIIIRPSAIPNAFPDICANGIFTLFFICKKTTMQTTFVTCFWLKWLETSLF